jgi:hypothetical protein
VSFVPSRRPAIVAGLVSLSLAGVAAVPASAHDYPAKVNSNFMQSCVKSARDTGASRSKATRYCDAVLDCLHDKLTLRQFIAADAAASAGRKSKYDKVVAGCVKKGNAAVS